MNYTESLEYLNKLYGMLGYDLGLGRVEALMKSMGNPQDKAKIVHVAGTNGKGSICSMMTSILIASGYKVGTYTSPHLEKYNERITVNNKQISEEDFAKHMTLVKNKCAEIANEGVSQPTVFEVVTAAAFNYFAEKQVDYIVLEVGMGGRCDATNVIKKPEVSVIASISMDHMEYLGDTLAKIAYEKGGIVKENCPTVLISENKEVYDTIKQICKQKNSKLYYLSETGAKAVKQDIAGTVFDVKNEYLDYKNIKISLLGEYQLMNATETLLACKAMNDNGAKLSEKAVFDGLADAKWKGRMEIVEKEPFVLLDGAHNIDGITMLSKSLKKYFSDKQITLLIGILGDKEYKKMLEVIIPLASKVVFTEPHSNRKWHVEAVEGLVKKYDVEVHIEKDISKAYTLAKSITDKKNVVVCAGSLYLIGELYKLARASEGGII
ncbi:MAG: bifunctional folylpolyglutamate synthase/dihydrofolate synthase [Clostridia bacterium]|jgi:dihydrofolate synthase/folylpolyglutamate synthase|nr:bifunctional folylpolyglutamate synthase/dihydrofolate synthase [Clostridia bacterium]MCI2015530.1 bifunctional folylpolyglutamate synthase/dihydrofolate synthase [Clostridia bacterium]